MRVHTTQLHELGFAVANSGISQDSLSELTGLFDTAFEQLRNRAGARLATTEPIIEQTLRAPAIASLLDDAIGAPWTIRRALLFDKSADSNWAVTTHRDTTIAVRERIDSPGYGPWSIKNNTVHVRPPAEVLREMVTLRLHLDDATPTTGGLRFVPTSHLDPNPYDTPHDQREARDAPARRGEVTLFKPLTLHSSNKMTTEARRRVIHLECGPQSSRLATPLDWA